MTKGLPRDYARLHYAWFTDPVLVACAAQVPTAMHVWPVLLGMAKASSHVADNPLGVVSTSAGQLSLIIHASPATIDAAVQILAEGELIEVAKGRLGTFQITLAGFEKWQTPRGSSADTSQTHRDKQKHTSREKAAPRDASVTERDGEGEGEGNEREAAASSSTARGAAKPAADLAPPSARSTAGQIQNARRELQSHATAVIDAMIGRRQAGTDRMLSEATLLADYWAPALKLRHEHGPLRLREALNRAAAANAAHLGYLTPILVESASAAEAASRPRRKLADVIDAHEAFWAEAAS